ncbi:MAG: transposase family protein [Holosporales bacterium]|nr:transposase family protein [Holosporales bacterium]
MNVDDPRSWKNQVHDFTSLIGTTFCAALAGIDGFSGISDFVEMHFQCYLNILTYLVVCQVTTRINAFGTQFLQRNFAIVSLNLSNVYRKFAAKL